MATLNPQWLIGRTIVAVEMRPFDARETGPVETAHNPIITFDNGARITFMAEETDFDESGVNILYHKPRK